MEQVLHMPEVGMQVEFSSERDKTSMRADEDR